MVAALLFWKGKEAKKFVEQRLGNRRQADDEAEPLDRQPGNGR